MHCSFALNLRCTVVAAAKTFSPPPQGAVFLLLLLRRKLFKAEWTTEFIKEVAYSEGMETKKFVNVVLVIGIVLFCISLFFDNQIINAIPSLRSEIIDAIAQGLAVINRVVILVVVSLMLCKKRTQIRDWCLVYLGGSAVAWALKELIQRPRPFETGAITPLVEATGYAFPSGHATVLFAAFPLLVTAYPSYRWLILVIAMILILTRVYLGIHYISDIIGGAVIGIVVSQIMLAIIHRVLPNKA